MKSVNEWISIYTKGNFGSLKQFWMRIQQDARTAGVREGLERAAKECDQLGKECAEVNQCHLIDAVEIRALIEADEKGNDNVEADTA